MTGRRVMVITGARKGIGRFLAEHYASCGVVVIGCSREPSDFLHDSYTHHTLSIADEAAVCRMFASIRSSHGRLDFLLNNAAVSSMNHCFLTPVATIKRILETNTLGTFLASREAAKLMKKNGFGRIVNFTTNAIQIRLPGQSAYLASKHAVIGLTETLALELAGAGITVNALGPTAMRTSLTRGVPEGKLIRLLDQQGIRRMAEAEDVIHAVDFLTSPASGMVTGQVINLGGV